MVEDTNGWRGKVEGKEVYDWWIMNYIFIIL